MLQSEFEKYLKSLGISVKSFKNYKSDIGHFFSWVMLKLRSFGSFIESLDEVVPFLSRDLIIEYKTYMNQNQTSDKTINRRLSTIRHLSRFLVSLSLIDVDFMDGVENIGSSKNANLPRQHRLVSEFKSYLETERVSDNTIKNYLSDIRQFITWLENNHARFT